MGGNSYQISSFEKHELYSGLNIKRDAVYTNNHSIEFNQNKVRDSQGDDVSFTVIKDHTESLLEDTQNEVRYGRTSTKSKIMIDENGNMMSSQNQFGKDHTGE